ncbi:hypothetical protein [Streptomyces sp. NPDC093600]|uniref:hypothetical protein n=1 Tax=Streptomyces sp. NPDC093600 TaxID=3366047 RepID=UPI003812E1B5
MRAAGDDVVARLHDVDEDVTGVQVGHQVSLVRLAGGVDGIADGAVRPIVPEVVVEFVVEAQQSQHRAGVLGVPVLIADLGALLEAG